MSDTLSRNDIFDVANTNYYRPNPQQLVGEIPCGQNLVIISKVKDLKAREY